MAIRSYCATHWGTREAQLIEPEATMPEGAMCVVCNVAACRAEGVAPELEASFEDRDEAQGRALQVENVRQSKRPSKRP